MKSYSMNSPAQKPLVLLFFLISLCCCALAQQCGTQGGGKLCSNGLCCSQYGYCGSTSTYCATGCQSQCSGSSPSGGNGGVSSIITSSVFDKFFSHRNDGSCAAKGFHTYNAFLSGAAAFSGFGTGADSDSNKRELAAFFANAAHETTGGCYKEEIDQSSSYCSSSAQWTCAAGKKYFGRGPLQISWNYNYGPAGKAIGFDGINNPGVVATDPVISFKTAVWFWMTTQCHSAITGGQGFGKTVSIINGGIECGGASATGKAAQQDRIALYKQFCGVLGVQPGTQLTC